MSANTDGLRETLRVLDWAQQALKELSGKSPAKLETGFPIRVVFKGEVAGYAVHSWNEHSGAYQPIGRFHSHISGAIRERAELVDELEQQIREGGAV